jgi:hypothetical protein
MFYLVLLMASMCIGCSQKSDQKTGKKATNPPPTKEYDYSLLSEDSLIMHDFKEYGFSLTLPSTYEVTTARTIRNLALTLHKQDSTLAVVVVHKLDSDDFWDFRDSLRLNPDSVLAYAQHKSRLPFYADGVDGTSYPRIDSTKQFFTHGSLRAIAVYQTRIDKAWGDAVPQFPPYQESRIGPFFWVDLWTPNRKLILEIRYPNPGLDTLATDRFVIAVINSISRLD